MSELFESAADFLSGDMNIEYLVDGIIEKNTTGAMFGESGAGKSFIAVDLGLSVSVGIEIFNGFLAEMGLVLYVAGEGYGGLKRRVKAWQLYNEVTKEDLRLFHLSNKTICIDGAGADNIIEEGKRLQEKFEVPVALIIIDTLARHFDGDENSSNDMGKFIKEVDRLRFNFPGSVAIVVHHTGHNEPKRARGSSSLKGAMDLQMLISKEKGKDKAKGKIIFDKVKDRELLEEIGFKLFPVEIGLDKKLKPITSCIVEYGEVNKSESQAIMSDHEDIALNALIAVCIRERNIIDDQYYGSKEGWRVEFYSSLQSCSEKQISQGNLKVSFQRVQGNKTSQGLEGKGIVSLTEYGVLPIRKKDQAKIADEINKGMRTEHGT